MLFCVFAKCSSCARWQVQCSVFQARPGVSSSTYPTRTPPDANKRRSVDFFSGVYHDLLHEYQHVISDTRFKDVLNKQVEIFDNTVISLFQDILKCVGRTSNSKRRDQVHTVINVDEPVPKMIWFSSAATNDHLLLRKLERMTILLRLRQGIQRL